MYLYTACRVVRCEFTIIPILGIFPLILCTPLLFAIWDRCTAPSSLELECARVFDEHVAVLVVSSRFPLGDADDCEYGFAFDEDSVHLLEGAVRGFGIEEIHHWDDKCIARSIVSTTLQEM